MRTLENVKIVDTIAPQLLNNGTATGSAVEVAGYGQAKVVVAFGATDVTATVLRLEESDDNVGWSTVTGGEFTGSDLPQAATADNKFWEFSYNVLGKGKRYVRAVLTVGNATGAYVHGYVMLAEGTTEQTAAGRGYNKLVNC